MSDELKTKALEYHSKGRAGKIEVIATKPCKTADDLSLAYTPGVAKPVLEIAENPNDAYKYTSKGNLVAVISNGTAILGLGDRGALASKPVMEGKGILFKRFADIDVFDIEINEKNPDKIIEIVKALEPTFGGINLEDIKAPECFKIEKTLIEKCDIPVFHDDQHGTAIICSAALINALEIANIDKKNAKIVFNGAGSAGISCAKMFVALGVPRENIIMCDSKGVITKERIESVTEEKREFATDLKVKNLEEAMKGANVFAGLSVADCVSEDMVKSMAKNPIIFAMANPNPEIQYEKAIAIRDDLIMATGRSDYPNQINNVLGFPFIFRGALDVKAKAISEKMKMAASLALAALAKEKVPEEVFKAYGNKTFEFGKNYIVPKPFDPRVIEWVSPAVAKAACDEGLAREPITDFEKYKASLKDRMKKYWN
ncbi:malate dehydrogenase [Brachyspira pilosicoli]|uniref:Malate dehydrogenase n=1 Tax=Brachyspira pilosicoli TaxID=52584 RepID=A0AAJ6K746_BRAPL|nr:malic enzyme-like NAD(P)-binding protein [Brachyspira pilosicoli]MBW5382641.1 malate dehydrogenase [Brachyspira pilosicoli]WIH84776.1 malate dehydrogenase [Brachyspira pilosicoli]WIH89246.1 malate dehydrogenase [Brachyspira pilosicoli]WIH91541.1 malate dehydrogenase [Brachyspira pilosicoli]WIH93830.1 malate dehydrogenase [Brachyspira pilosicoli]